MAVTADLRRRLTQLEHLARLETGAGPSARDILAARLERMASRMDAPAETAETWAEAFDPDKLPTDAPAALRDTYTRLATLGGDAPAPRGFEPEAYTRHPHGAELREAAREAADAAAALTTSRREKEVQTQ